MKIFILFLPVLLIFTACQTTEIATPTHNPYTHGNVQLTLRKGTSQAEVLEKFGAPNIATTDGEGNEVWTYQKHASVAKSKSSDSYGTIILFGGSSRSSGFESSSRTMTLIIKFDSNKTVKDFKSMSSSF
jgi:outer membrane protein assembly factor BamE (lipoprotein component of BamABCDE complex)